MVRMLVTCRLEATDQITQCKALRLLGKALFSAYIYTDRREREKKRQKETKNEFSYISQTAA